MIAALQTKPVGHFLIKSGHLRITDPYAANPLGPYGTFSASPGRWGGFVTRGPWGDCGVRVWELAAAKLPFRPQKITNLKRWRLDSFSVTVFSGLCGIVDDAEYPENGYDRTETIDKIVRDTANCGAAVLKTGVFSEAGWGNDGKYDVHTALYENGVVSAIRIVFLEPSEVTPFDDLAVLRALAGE